MDINNNDTVETSTWKSCCLQVDKNAVKYVIQVATIGSLFTVSLVMLIIDDNCINQRNWASLLTLSIGIICPSPKMSS